MGPDRPSLEVKVELGVIGVDFGCETGGLQSIFFQRTIAGQWLVETADGNPVRTGDDSIPFLIRAEHE